MTKPLQAILYVDDEPDIREIVRMSIESLSDWKVETTDSGEAALKLLEQRLPDLVILDCMMPDMDGPTTLQKIRAHARTAGLPVIFLTAKAHGSEVTRLKSLGAAGVVGKPFDPMKLCDQLLDIWRSMPE